jgi:polar amino acid transport system permease protein
MIREAGTCSIVYYLVLAVRWTIALTLLALAGGSVIGLLVAAGGASQPIRAAALAGPHGYVGVVQGIPLAGLAVHLLFRPVHRGVRPATAGGRDGRLLGLRRRVPGRDLARRAGGDPEDAVGGRGLDRPDVRGAAAPRHHPAGGAARDSHRPSGFLVQLIKNTSLAAVIGFVELTREGQTDHRGDVPAVRRLPAGRSPVFQPVLSADAVQPDFGR